MTLHAIEEVQDREWQREIDRLIHSVIDELALAERGLKAEIVPGGGKPHTTPPGDPHRAGTLREALVYVRAAQRLLNQDLDQVLGGHQPREITGDRNPRWMSTEEFRAVFEASGLTQMELAARLPISQRMVSYWLSGEKRISEGASKRIWQLFGRMK